MRAKQSLARQSGDLVRSKYAGQGEALRYAASSLSTSAEGRSNDPEQLKEDLNYCVNLVRERDREGFCEYLISCSQI